MSTSNLTATAYNYMTTNRWIALLPFQTIDPNYTVKNTAFNLTSFEMPEILLGSTDVPALGYTFPFPNYTIQTNKEMTFYYMLSSDCHQYTLLWQWATKIVVEDGAGAPGTFTRKCDGTGAFNQFMLPITVLMLSEFKHPALQIIYHNCWIKSVGPISFDYQDPDATAIKHSFTVTYSHFNFTIPEKL